jgi:hypothetical protein
MVGISNFRNMGNSVFHSLWISVFRPLANCAFHPVCHLRRCYLKDSIFGALDLRAFAEMIRKAFGKNYRTQDIDFQIGEVPVSFENPVLLELLDRQHAACAQSSRQQSNGGLSLVPHPPRSRQHPGPRVLDVGGDLSSGSSESHTDVAIRDGSRRTPGLVDSSGYLHTGSSGHVITYRGAGLRYDRAIATINWLPISPIRNRSARSCSI